MAFDRQWRCPLRPVPHRVVVQAIRNGGLAVTRRHKDPALMTPQERLVELGELLAAGVRRTRLSRETGLAEGGEKERPCDGPVDTPENPANQEIA